LPESADTKKLIDPSVVFTTVFTGTNAVVVPENLAKVAMPVATEAGNRKSEKSAIQLSRSASVLVAARVDFRVRSTSHWTHSATAALASSMARRTEPTEISMRLPADAVIAADIS
jgi:hypothetical protein